MIRFSSKIRRSARYGARAVEILAAVALPGALTAAYAQDASTTSPPTTLPPVIVQGAPRPTTSPKKAKKPERTAPAERQSGTAAANVSRTSEGQTPVISPTTISTPIDQVPSSITVVTGEQLRQEQRQTVADALAAVPGLNVVQSGGPGGQTSVFMRGTNSNQVKVLVDGIDVSDPSNFNGSFDFAHLMTGDLARIEVLRGPQSGLYGADALGGVISIVTQKGEGPAQAYASAEAGSFGTFNQATGASGSGQGYNYAFNIAHYRADDIPVTPNYLVPPGDTRLNNSYDNMTYSTKLGLDISKELTFNFVARYVDSTYIYNGLYNYCSTCAFKYVQEPEQTTQINQQFWTRGEAVWSLFDGRFKNYFGLAYTDSWTNINDPWPASFPYVSTYEGERVKYDWRGVAELAPGQFLLTGVERTNETMNIIQDPYANTGIYRTGDTAAWAQIQSEWSKRFFLNANIRYDDDDYWGGHTTWRLAAAFIVPGIDTKLKASYGTGFKAPTLQELYVPYYNYLNNPNLQPEESQGFDVGFEQPLFDDRVRFGATYFQNDITNLITYGTLDGVHPTTVNIGNALTYGAESFASFAITPEWKVRADYTYTIARDEDKGEDLLRRPKNKVSLTSSWKATDDLTLSATVNHVGSWKDAFIGNNSAPGYTAPGFTTVNIAATYAATDRISVFGRIDNLFDVKYEDPAGYLRPGIGVFGGLKVTTRVADLLEPAK